MIKKEYIFIFIFLSLISLLNIANLCKTYYPFQFDTQILLTWQYSASIGQIPYKDIFYPYGLLSYYKGFNLFFSLVYYFLTPLLGTFFYFLFLKSYKDRFFAIVSLLTLFLFINVFTGYEYFARYGTAVAYTCLVAYLFYFKKIKSKKVVISLGLLGGGILPYYNDQGVYVAALYIQFLMLDVLLQREYKKMSVLYEKIVQIFLYLLGYSISLIPFICFLLYQKSLTTYISTLAELSDLQQIAKTPYFHGFMQPDIVFTLSLLILTIVCICYKLYTQKTSLVTYIQIGIVLSLVTLEQKSVIRHIDSALTFIGLLLFLYLFYECKKLFARYSISDSFIYVYYVAIVIFLFFITDFKKPYAEKNPYSCSTRFTIQEKSFTKVKNTLKTYANFNGKIFSFPGDEIFYILFNQHPPYYPSAFESSSIAAQKKQINYLSDNKITYVIYNIDTLAIQDEVPDVIRVPLLHHYILTHYVIRTKVDNFLILEKSNDDFFSNQNLKEISSFKNALLFIDLQSIPESEGIYKRKYLTDEKNSLLFTTHSQNEVSTYFASNTTDTAQKFLAVTSTNDGEAHITITTIDGYSTQVKFKSCTNKNVCLINLSHLPLFYNTRIIKDITIGKEVNELSLYSISNDYPFW